MHSSIGCGIILFAYLVVAKLPARARVKGVSGIKFMTWGWNFF